MTSPLVTIIIPIYNVGKYLRKSIESAINQTLKNIEIICVDDSSTDNSLEIVREFALKDSRIKLIELEENQGQGIARNTALKIASGEYIMFLDADDWLELDACETAYNQISKNNNDMVMFGFNQYYEDRDLLEVMDYWLYAFEDVLDNPQIELKNLRTNFMKNAYSVNKIYKKQFLNENNIKFSHYRTDEDNIFSVNVLISAKTISIITRPLYNYRINKNSTSFNTKLWKEMIDARIASYELLKKRRVNATFMNTFIMYCMEALPHWYKRYAELDPKIARDLYNETRNFFIRINKEQDITKIESKHKNDFNQFLYLTYTQFFIQCIIKKILQELFSLKNIYIENNKCKVIKILGIKLIISRYKNVHQNYNSNLKKLVKKYRNGKKINVLFLSSECQKWTYDSLYRELEESKIFNPKVLVIPLNKKGFDVPLEDNYTFYKKRDINVEYGYKNGKFINLKTFKPDIVFYQQKWYLPSFYEPNKVSKYALTCFSSYGYEIENLEENYSNDFHPYLFKYFIEHELNLKRYMLYNKNAKNNCIITGYPKLDAYLDKSENKFLKHWQYLNKFKIIYAPHWSFFYSGGYNLSTFLENYDFILNLAKKYSQETVWCFKPHPRLRYELLSRKIMTEEEVNDYFDEWRKLGFVYDAGGYIDLFKSSDMMITDSSSFLAEYLPSKKPLIRLVKKQRSSLNLLGEKLTSEYYVARDNEELSNIFNTIVIEKNDYKKDAREKLVTDIIDDKEAASKKIYKYLLSLVQGK